jgi:ATP-dependent Clp protease ATP-binding subunit ClpA
MDTEMATLILEKKLGELEEKLIKKNVTMNLSQEAKNWLLKKGFTREYGAREIERVITSNLKPLLMKEILFGRLKDGGEATIGVKEDKLLIM